MNQHRLKAAQAYAAFTRHFNNTRDETTRAAMLDFYQRLFVKEAVNAQLQPAELTDVERTDLRRMQGTLKGMIVEERERLAQLSTRSSGAYLKPIASADRKLTPWEQRKIAKK